jgi:hypothetical protein
VPVTPVYGLPYQGLSDTPDGPNLGEDLALAIEAQIARIDGVAAAAAARLAVVRKTADEVISNTTTLQNDDVLLLPVAANTTYEFVMMVGFGASTVADFKWALTFPAGVTAHVHDIRQDTATLTTYILGATTGYASGTAIAIGGTGAASFRTIWLRALIIVTSTAGTLQFQWAQNTAEVSNATVRAGSYLKLLQIEP